MRDYIILNGVSSQTIAGLLIQNLPPISKPKQRVSVEEIDGRDGDIVTYLGYGAYDKEFEIGLFGDFDINEIISFFNSQGTVTFSNEDDKYYNYQIIEQINFDKLIRYKKAKVKMHVQPFKFSLTDNEKTFNINNSLLTFNNYSVISNGITATYSNGTLTVNGTSTNVTSILFPITELTLTSGSYTLSGLATGTVSGTVNVVNSSNTSSFTAVTLVNGTIASSTATLTSDETYNYINISIDRNTTVNFTLDLKLINNSGSGSVSIRNVGNIYSRPIMTITGSGIINLSLNNNQIFAINMGEYESITIDTTQMEAYNGSVLLNRNVTGNYDNFKLNVGNNTISWSGTITQIEISNYSRWL